MSPPEHAFKSFLFDARIEFMCRHRSMTMAGYACIAIITASFLWPRASHGLVLAWLGLMLCASLTSFFCLTPRNKQSQGFDGDRWLQRAIFASLFMGLTWGIVPPLFYSASDSSYLVVICCIYTGFISAAIPTTFAYSPVFYSFALGITAPFWWLTLVTDGYEYEFLSVTLFAYVGILVFAAHNIHNLFLNSTRSNYDKLRLVEELKHEKNVAHRATKAKDQFFAAASHDLRQPLNAINLFVDALQNRYSQHSIDEDSDLAILAKIRRSLRGLNGMLHSLLDISKLDANAVKNDPKDTSLSSVVSQLVDEYSTKLQHISLRNEVDSDLVVLADPIILYRVIRNILDNAIKFTQQGHVLIRNESGGSHIRLFIEDTGVGIPDSNLENVFNEFEQLSNPERNREKGLGLGLAIVKRLCALAGFQISLRSIRGNGTTVELVIPVGDPVGEADASGTQSIDFQHRHIVVIDDEADILEGMESVLSAWGVDVTTASSLKQALSRLTDASKKPEAIICDLRLKNNELGTDVIESIREEFNTDIPAVLITGDTAPDRIVTAHAADVVVMYKPIDSSELKRTLSKLLRD